MFLLLSVILFMGGVCHTPPGQTASCPVHAGIHTPLLHSACWDTHTPPAQCMLGYGQQAGGTHPT